MTRDDELANTYRNILWGLIISLVFGGFGYGFFLYGQMVDIRKAQDQRQFWWTWMEQQDATQKKELEAVKTRMDSLEREVYSEPYWRYKEKQATEDLYRQRQRNGVK
jgi:hypothetical protein